MNKFNEEYIELQIGGSDWSYGSAWGDQMVDALKEIFGPKPKDSRILDVGCGEGRGLQTLDELGYQRYNLMGVDINQLKLKGASARGYFVINQDFHKLNLIPHNYFDYVFCSHTLEHAYDLDMAMRSIIRVCSKSVYFIVPVGETEEDVKKYNPSHTSPIYDQDTLKVYLDQYKTEKFIENYCIEEKSRLCKELWITISRYKND